LSLFLGINKLALVLLDLVLLLPDVHHLLLIVDLTLLKRRLLDLDFLIQEVKFLVSLDQLRRQDITLVHHHFVILLLLGFFGLGLRDDVLQARDIVLLSLNHLISACNLLQDLLELLLIYGA